MSIVEFGKCQFLSFASNWITLKELAVLDTSYCNRTFRQVFLKYLHSSQNAFDNFQRIVPVSGNITRYRGSSELFLWLNLRNIKVCSLILNDANIFHAHLHAKEVLWKVKRVYIEVTCVSHVSLLVDLISKCVASEEIYFFSHAQVSSVSTSTNPELILDDKLFFRAVVRHCFKLKVFVYRSEWGILDLSLDVLELSQNCAAMETIDFGWHLTDEGVVSLCNNCPKLASINLKRCADITDVSVNALTKAFNLTDVNTVYYGERNTTQNAMISLVQIHCNKLKILKVGWCEGFCASKMVNCLAQYQQNLTTLSLCYSSHLSDTDITTLCSACKQITNLSIRKCGRLTASGAALTITNKLQHLTRIVFQQSKNITSKAMFLVFAQRFEQFLEIDLSSFVIEGVPFIGCFNILHVVDYSSLTAMDWNDHLFSEFMLDRCMNLHTFKLTEFHFEFSNRFDQIMWGVCKNLRKLIVNRVSMTCILLGHECSLNYECGDDLLDDNLAIIALRCRNLETLDVGRRQRLTDAGMTLIAAQCLNLTSIDYQYCSRLSDVTVTAIAKQCHNLRNLNVDGTHFSDTAVVNLASGCPRLTHLSKLNTKGIVTLANIMILVSKCCDLAYVCSSEFSYSYSRDKGAYFDSCRK